METREISVLIDKYWGGTSTLEEESQIKAYFNSDKVDDSLLELRPLFAYFSEAGLDSQDKLPSDYIKTEIEESNDQKESDTRIINLRWLRAVAAVGVLLLGAYFVFNPSFQTNEKSASISANNAEIEDVEEAYEITREALAFLSNKYTKGTDPLATLPKSINSTRIFK